MIVIALSGDSALTGFEAACPDDFSDKAGTSGGYDTYRQAEDLVSEIDTKSVQHRT